MAHDHPKECNCSSCHWERVVAGARAPLEKEIKRLEKQIEDMCDGCNGGIEAERAKDDEIARLRDYLHKCGMLIGKGESHPEDIPGYVKELCAERDAAVGVLREFYGMTGDDPSTNENSRETIAAQRRILQRLCKQAGIDLDTEQEGEG